MFIVTLDFIYEFPKVLNKRGTFSLIFNLVKYMCFQFINNILISLWCSEKI